MPLLRRSRQYKPKVILGISIKLVPEDSSRIFGTGEIWSVRNEEMGAQKIVSIIESLLAHGQSNINTDRTVKVEFIELVEETYGIARIQLNPNEEQEYKITRARERITTQVRNWLNTLQDETKSPYSKIIRTIDLIRYTQVELEDMTNEYNN